MNTFKTQFGHTVGAMQASGVETKLGEDNMKMAGSGGGGREKGQPGKGLILSVSTSFSAAPPPHCPRKQSGEVPLTCNKRAALGVGH